MVVQYRHGPVTYHGDKTSRRSNHMLYIMIILYIQHVITSSTRFISMICDRSMSVLYNHMIILQSYYHMVVQYRHGPVRVIIIWLYSTDMALSRIMEIKRVDYYIYSMWLLRLLVVSPWYVTGPCLYCTTIW
jgi:hypothetical protein